MAAVIGYGDGGSGGNFPGVRAIKPVERQHGRRNIVRIRDVNAIISKAAIFKLLYNFYFNTDFDQILTKYNHII